MSARYMLGTGCPEVVERSAAWVAKQTIQTYILTMYALYNWDPLEIPSRAAIEDFRDQDDESRVR